MLSCIGMGDLDPSLRQGRKSNQFLSTVTTLSLFGMSTPIAGKKLCANS